MPCYHPIPAWYARRRNESGKRSIVFNVAEGFKDRPVQVPCGRCLGCRLEYARQWAMRCMHESKMHDVSIFATLTYRDDRLPAGGSLNPRDFVLFMKRLRHVVPGVRFFQCGEYGERLSRPHHHALLFGCFFDDRRVYKERDGVPLYTSKTLDDLWGNGQCSFGAVTFESASYVARYTMKKVGSVSDYGSRVREYCTMSRRPGIGAGFLDKYRSDVYPSDSVVVRGVESRPPKYYDMRLENVAPSVAFRVKAKRRRKALEELNRVGVESEYRDAVAGELVHYNKLKVSEIVKESTVKLLVREYENA